MGISTKNRGTPRMLWLATSSKQRWEQVKVRDKRARKQSNMRKQYISIYIYLNIYIFIYIYTYIYCINMYKLVKPCPEKAGVVLQCVLEQLDPCSRDHVSNNFSKAVPMTYELPADFGASGSPFTSQSRYIPCEQFHCQRTERPLLQYHYAKLQEPPWFTGG